MKTHVRVVRGRFGGRTGWIAGSLADRAARGITKALVHVPGEECELLQTRDLAPVAQLDLFAAKPTKKPPADAGGF